MATPSKKKAEGLTRAATSLSPCACISYLDRVVCRVLAREAMESATHVHHLQRHVPAAELPKIKRPRRLLGSAVGSRSSSSCGGGSGSSCSRRACARRGGGGQRWTGRVACVKQTIFVTTKY